MKGQSKFIALITSLIIAACSSSDSPQTLGDISFEDPYIENCVYKRQWQWSEDGTYQHVHSVTGPDGDYYFEGEKTPLTGVYEVRDCEYYNSNFGSVPNMPAIANHLNDLAKLPYLEHLVLDFNVLDFSALSRLDQVETLEIPKVYGIDDQRFPNLSDISGMDALRKLIFYGDTYQDFSALSASQQLEYLQFGMPDPQKSTLTSRDLPAGLKSLTLWNTWFANASDYSDLTELEEFVLVGKSYYWDQSEGLVEPDYGILAGFQNLSSLKLKFTSFTDLSVIPSSHLKTLNLTMTNQEFNQVDWSYLDNLNKLTNLLVVAYDDPTSEGNYTPNSRTFHTRFYEYEKALAGEYGGVSVGDNTLYDTMYALMGMTEQQATVLSSQYQFELISDSWHNDSRDLNTYLIRDLSHDVVVELFQHWLNGDITTFH